jgi:SAM-dependent methyltransferase
MTDKDREKWDARYLTRMGGMQPSAIVKTFWSIAPAGKALDIACGNGRNALFLAARGFEVDAVDISTVATARLAGQSPRITVIQADLDTWRIPKDRYTLVLNIRFLDRRLFPMIIAGMQPGGVLIVESFLDDRQGRYCLKPNELIRAFRSLRIVYYREKQSNQTDKFDQIAALAAVKPDSPPS